MKTDVRSGYPGVCDAGEGDARSVHHTAVHLLGQAALALLASLDARAGVNELVILLFLQMLCDTQSDIERADEA